MSEYITFLLYVATWVAFGGVAFLFAFMKALTAHRGALQLPVAERRPIIIECAVSASKWFQGGALEAFAVWATMLAAGTLELYLTFDVLVYAILFPICAALFPKEIWERIIGGLQPLLDYFTAERRAARAKVKRTRRIAKRQRKLDQIKQELAATEEEEAVLAEI